MKMAQPTIMFCSPSGYDLHKESLDKVGCIEKYIVYGDQVKPDSMLFKEFLTEHGDVSDFKAVPVDGSKDLLLIMYSSGTTGLPKGVPLTHLGMMVNSEQLTNASFKNVGVLNTREWYFSYGLMYTLALLKRGATVVYSPKNTHADCLDAIQKYKVKYLQITPGTVTEIIKSTILDDYDVSSVEIIVSSSTPIKTDQVEAVRQRLSGLKEVYQFYGSTEGGGGICNELDAPLGPKYGSVGIPIFGVTIKVVDQQTRQPLGPGQRGEICFKSASLTPGYLCTPHRDYMDEEEFFMTGDIGYYDEDNYFFIVNRIKELIKFNDFAIAPAELESVLLNHPSVADAGVVGAPSERWGEAPTAFVTLQPGCSATEEELVKFVNSNVTFRMRLEGGVRFVNEIPRGAGGKMDRAALKKML